VVFDVGSDMWWHNHYPAAARLRGVDLAAVAVKGKVGRAAKSTTAPKPKRKRRAMKG
jgi:hypothetical protein